MRPITPPGYAIRVVQDDISALRTSSYIARRCNISTDRVRQLARAGKLHPAYVTSTGQRLFTDEEVDRFLSERNKSVADRTAA